MCRSPWACSSAIAASAGTQTPPAGPAPGAVVNIREVPLTKFPGDILVSSGGDTIIDVLSILGESCVGFAVVNVVFPVLISINGGGYRTFYGACVIDHADISNLRVSCPNGTGCTIQLLGE